MKFTILCKDAEALLEDICLAKSPVEMLQKRLKNAESVSLTKEWELRGLIGELKKAGYIATYWAEDTVHYCRPQMSIETYRKRLEEHKAFLKEVNASSNITNNIDNSTNTTFNMGNNNKIKNIAISDNNNNQTTQPKTNFLSSIFKGITNLVMRVLGLELN